MVRFLLAGKGSFSADSGESMVSARGHGVVTEAGDGTTDGARVSPYKGKVYPLAHGHLKACMFNMYTMGFVTD